MTHSTLQQTTLERATTYKAISGEKWEKRTNNGTKERPVVESPFTKRGLKQEVSPSEVLLQFASD